MKSSCSRSTRPESIRLASAIVSRTSTRTREARASRCPVAAISGKPERLMRHSVDRRFAHARASGVSGHRVAATNSRTSGCSWTARKARTRCPVSGSQTFWWSQISSNPLSSESRISARGAGVEVGVSPPGPDADGEGAAIIVSPGRTVLTNQARTEVIEEYLGRPSCRLPPTEP